MEDDFLEMQYEDRWVSDADEDRWEGEDSEDPSWDHVALMEG